MSPWLLLHLLYLIPLTFLLWAQLHERAHVWMADHLIGVVYYKISTWPRWYEGGVRWAHVKYYMVRQPTAPERFWISMAPRIPSAVGVILAPLGPWFLSGWLLLVWLTVWGGGVVDLITNSLGLHESTDLRKAARATNTSPWLYRIVGICVALSSIGAAVWGMVVELL